MKRLAAVLIVTLIPAAALAQETRMPRVEFAAHVSEQTGRQQSATWSPRISWNVTPLSAIEATADFGPPNTDPAWGRHTSARAYSLHLRQSLLTRGRWQVFGVFGVGSSETHTKFLRHIVTVGDYSWDIPEQTIEETSVAVHVGPAAQVRVAPWLSLRADVRLTLSHASGIRGMIGAVVPVGTLPPNPKFTQRDRLGNGIRNGAVTGAISGGALYAWGALALCDTDDCGQFALSAITFGTVSGAVVGGLLGAMIDSLISKR